MVNTVGFKEFEAKLQNLPKHIEEGVNGLVEDAALEWEERAKLDAPVDTGFLRRGITTKLPVVKMTTEVTSNMNYSAYVEWGTGTRVSVPSGLQSYAQQFKGKIQVIGRYPKPFFFIQAPLIQKRLYGDVDTFLNTQV